MSIKGEYDENQCASTNRPNENIEENHVFIKEPKLEPKIEFDAKNANTDHEVFVMDPLDVENYHHREEKKVYVCENFPCNFII